MPRADASVGLVVGDVGADAVLLDAHERLRARAHCPLGASLRASCVRTLDALAGDLGRALPAATRVTLGTGAMRAALDDAESLSRVAVLRIGGPLTGAVPPLWTWPPDLRSAVSVGEAVVDGGAEYDGRRAAALDAEAVVRFLDGLDDAADAVAITSVFSPIGAEDELVAAELVLRELGPTVSVSLSHEIGSLGLLERESATALNAALVRPAQELFTMLLSVLGERGVAAEPYVAQNDGAAMALEHALRYPLQMLESAAALWMRGAAFLSGITECVVVDHDGARGDVGLLVSGVLPETWDVTEIAGVRTVLRRPRIEQLDGGARLGEGPVDAVRRALAASAVLSDATARARDGNGRPVVVVAVGSGAPAVDDALAGRADVEVTVPPEADVAGAIGAAVAVAAGQVEVVCSHEERALRTAVTRARRAAIERAIHAGADPSVVQVIEVEQLPLSYLVEPALRIRVRAAGPCV
jgi:N-methylhydantoinase A/oxoprolinase/acetone carboxylase beta subunit